MVERTARRWRWLGPALRFVLIGSAATVAVAALSLTGSRDDAELAQRIATGPTFRNWNCVERAGRGWRRHESSWITRETLGQPGGWVALPMEGLRGDNPERAAMVFGKDGWIHPMAWATFAAPAPTDPARGLTQAILEEIGWPCTAFRGGVSIRIADQTRPKAEAIERHGAILADDAEFLGQGPWSNARVIPLRPAPVGFAVNTIVFGSVAAAIVAIRRRFVRTGRRQRGECPACGHPLAGASRCVECGWLDPAAPGASDPAIG